MSKPVVITSYDPGWPARYEREAALARRALGDELLGIEHVGSTAVPGLAAKDIIDILAGVRDRDAAGRCLEPLAREGFSDATDVTEYEPDWFYCVGKGERPHDTHLHLCVHDGRFWERHLLFRDHLRAHPDLANEYADLKHRLAARHRDQRMAYCDAKTGFIRTVEVAARGISIGRMESGDIDRMYETFRGWGKEREKYAGYLARQERGEREVLVARSGEDVAGYTCLTFRSLYEPFLSGEIPEVVDLNVINRFQRLGVGTALVYRAEERARELGHPVIGIAVVQSPEYAPAQRLYERLGFEPDGRGLTEHDNELHFVKRLV